MWIDRFFGKTVKLLWNDVPYVGVLLLVDDGNNIVISNCRQFSGIICQMGSYDYTIKQLVNIVKLPIDGITWITDGDSFTSNVDLLEKTAEKYYMIHCSKCLKPTSVMPCRQDSKAEFTIIGGILQDAMYQNLKTFLDNLPLNCNACSGVYQSNGSI